MPTHYKPELTDNASPWVLIWERMYQGLLPNAQQIFGMLGYYAERDLQTPPADGPLSSEEESEFTPIVSALTIAAVETQSMRDGVLVATLSKLAKSPALFSADGTPAAVQWELASDYQRGEERSGAFAMDIWGTDQTTTSYIRGEPTPENIAGAAGRAASRIQEARSAGRPEHPAHPILAERLGRIFRASGGPIVRHREKTGELRVKAGKETLVYAETGPFHEFLEVVLKPLQDFLRERGLNPVTIDSIVRIAQTGRRR